MKNEIEPAVGISICIGTVFVMYFFLCWTGQIPNKDWWFGNLFYNFMTKIIHFLMIVIPTALAIWGGKTCYGRYRAIEDYANQKELDSKFHFQERCRLEKELRTQTSLSQRLQAIEEELKKINEALVSSKPVDEVSESTLNNFV